MKTSFITRILMIAILCVVSHLCYSQIDTGWVRRYVGPVFSDEARAICIDNDGNVIVTGTSVGITGGQFYDWLTIKYTSNGDVVWTQRQNGTCDREDYASDIAVDKFKNVYVTGSFSDTIQSLGNCTSNAALIKYSPSGDLLWLREWDGEPSFLEGGNYPVALVIDDSCNIYITGFFFAINPYQCYDFFTLKYDSAGTFQWVKTLNGICTSGNDYPTAMTLDKAGNIYVTGKSDSEPYWWKEDYLTVSYSPGGSERWVRRYDNGWIDIPRSIASDDSCNVYITGNSSGTLLTIKYDSAGTEQRIERYQPFYSETSGAAITLDVNRNIYIAGNHEDKYFTIRYNPDWTIEWTKEYWTYGPGQSGASQIIISTDTTLIVSGSSLCDIFTIKYDLNGNYKGAHRYNKIPGGCDWANDIAVDESGLVYVCGYSEGAGTGGDYVTMQYKSINYDYGDANGYPYPILLESDGARHIIDNVVFLGELVDDAEPDGMPTDFADGDDLDNLDDEDGVVFNSELRQGQNASIIINASVDYGLLNAWIDFSRDGDWNDGNEQIFTNQLLNSGTQELTFSIPKSDVWYSYNTYARFRYSSQPDLLPTGLAIDGEVEDYYIIIEPPYVFDFGDAPDAPYQTLLLNNCAYHFVDNITYLGMLVDAEADGLPSASALGDDLNNLADEDGVSFITLLVPREIATVQIFAANECLLNAWIDFNQLNSWADAGEQIFVNQPLTAGLNVLTFNVPAYAIPGTTFARFRANQYADISWFGYGYEGEVEDYMVIIEESPFEGYDYGDAPDVPYPTLLTSNGAHHYSDNFTYLGSLIDIEPDGLPSPLADGDDLSNLADEDGVTFVTALVPGTTSTLNVIAASNCLLNAWIDFNQVNAWADPGEQIFINQPLVAGLNVLDINIPLGAVTGTTYARFRVNQNGDVPYYGYGYEGEVEDYLVNIEEPPVEEYDYGDAPDWPYPTLLISNGARHYLVPGICLGNAIDTETEGQTGYYALGDDRVGSDDEDGVKFLNSFVVGQNVDIQFIIVGTGFINGWFDWDANGSWADAEEHAIVEFPVNSGVYTVSVSVPSSAILGLTYARFRFSSTQGLGYNGLAIDGEVEDYRFLINQPEENKMHYPQYPDPAGWDVNLSTPSKIGDDWMCSQTGPVGDIHFWISLKNDSYNFYGLNFLVEIYSDIPANLSPTGYSIPGEVLWTRNFDPWSFGFSWVFEHPQGWFEPYTNEFNQYDHNYCFRIDIDHIEEPFIQQQGTVYWLVITALPDYFPSKSIITDPVIITLDGIDPDIEPYETWDESGAILSFQDNPYTNTCSFGIFEGCVGIWPAMLNVDLSNITDQIMRVEIDICFATDLEVKLSDGPTIVDQMTTSGGLQTITLQNYDDYYPDLLTITDFEGCVCEIRLYFHGMEQPILGWKTSLDHFNDNAVYANFEPEYPWSVLYNPITQEGLSLSFIITEGEVTEYDFGDSPDGPYPTLSESNGAYHSLDGWTFLGSLIDTEPNGQPAQLADGDDLSNLADEDGVVFTSALIKGQGATIQVTVANPCILNAWIDFNQQNTWADAGEQIYTNQPLTAGTNNLSFTVPAGSAAGYTYARFRVNQFGGISYFGYGFEGEVEDYIVIIEPEATINLQDLILPSNSDTCFEASQTITTAGNGTIFITQSGAIIHLIAGNIIIMKDGTHFQSGSYVHAYIDQTGEYCTNPKAMLARVAEEVQPDVVSIESSTKESFFKVYPNPTTGQFTLELYEVDEFRIINVEIFSLIGESIMKEELPAMKHYLFDLSMRQPGIYLIRVMKDNDVGVVKVIRQ